MKNSFGLMTLRIATNKAEVMMAQFLPEVRGVFKLIERHKKDLEKAIIILEKNSQEDSGKNKHGKNNA